VQFGVQFPHGLYKGVIDYTIKELRPSTTYYFKVRGGNGCAPGGWSNTLSAKTEGYSIITPTPSQSMPSPTITAVPTKKPASQKPLLQKSLFQKILDFFLNRQ
jgi:hypothetical protein